MKVAFPRKGQVLLMRRTHGPGLGPSSVRFGRYSHPVSAPRGRVWKDPDADPGSSAQAELWILETVE